MLGDEPSPADSGQSTIIGFVLLFGIVVMLLLVLQTSAVPAWNQAVEFSHNERVQSEMESLRDDVLRTAATGSEGSGSISLGTRYPVRPFLINPADPSGTLRTREPATVTISNATATGETGHYWDGSTQSFTDRHVVYEPDYNEYDNAPTTVFENSAIFNRYGERTWPVTQERLVNGRRINLVLLNGSLSRSGIRPHTVETRALSAPEQVTTVRSDGPLVLTASTSLSEAAWRELLADERADAGGFVTDVTVTDGEPFDTLRLTLRAGESYDLRMARIGVGSGAVAPPAHYLTTESRADLQVPVGAGERIAFEARDRYNNPVSGVEVNATLSGPGTLTPVAPTTDADGHAVFRYDASASGDGVVQASFGTAPGARRTANVTVRAFDTGGGGTDGAGPLVTDLGTNATTASGQSVQQGAVLELAATATDFGRGGSDIYAVEWWSDRTEPGGGPGTGFGLAPQSGDEDEFDSVEEAVVGRVDTSGWAVGRHALSVRARDAAGNWGPVASYEIVVTGSGDSAAESASVVDGSATTTNNGGRFEFDLANTGDPATLRSASIDTSTLGGVRDGLNQIRINGSDRRANNRAYSSDGTQEPLDETVLGGTASVDFRSFPGNDQIPAGQYTARDRPPQSDDPYLTVSFVFDDGSTKQVYFTPP